MPQRGRTRWPRPFSSGEDSPFYVPPLLDLLGWWTAQHRDFWVWLGRLESCLFAHELSQIALTMPIYVAGLARSGSTLLHEIIASHPGVATQRIKDYPMVYTPIWWRRATAGVRPDAPRERAHRDKMMITRDSPDALEEMLWMAFFPRCHDHAVDNRLDARTRNARFEAFYTTHIRKLLQAEQAARYVAKANYHVARLPYLARLLPDARFILPIRAPASHIASLVRQHAWFCSGQRHNRRAVAFMQRSGHFEFGRDRRPMNLGDAERLRSVQRAWADGEEVRGWARYWDMVYGHVARMLASEPEVRARALIVRFEDMCKAPAESIRALVEHCRLAGAESVNAKFAGRIREPDYYQSSFSATELAVIREETAATAREWGY